MKPVLILLLHPHPSQPKECHQALHTRYYPPCQSFLMFFHQSKVCSSHLDFFREESASLSVTIFPCSIGLANRLSRCDSFLRFLNYPMNDEIPWPVCCHSFIGRHHSVLHELVMPRRPNLPSPACKFTTFYATIFDYHRFPDKRY